MGTRLRMRFPSVHPSTRSDMSHPLRVLVLDDVRDSADTLALLVRLWGHQPLVAYDGPAALQLARTHEPDVALLDIGLADGLDGCDVARRPRQLPGMKEALLVAVTGYGQEADIHRCKEAGIDCHFVKPVDPEKLREVLDQLAC